MRKITEQARAAMAYHAKPFTQTNTAVVEDKASNSRRLNLHGNTIAVVQKGKPVRFTLAGWPTPTTRERLNAVGVSIAQRNGEQFYINPITQEKTEICAHTWYSVDNCTGGVVEK